MWQKFIGFILCLYSSERVSKNWGMHSDAGGIFTFYFIVQTSGIVHSEYQSAPVTIQAMLLEMFIELPKMVKHEIKLKYLSWSLRVEKELDTFAFVIDISEPHIFSSIQEGTRPTSFRRRSLIPSLSIFLALFHCFYLHCLLTD